MASFWPAAELAYGATLEARVSIAAPIDHDLVFAVEAPAGIAGLPGTITLKAGETWVRFVLIGTQRGVEEVTLRPEDGAFEVVQARVRVI